MPREKQYQTDYQKIKRQETEKYSWVDKERNAETRCKKVFEGYQYSYILFALLEPFHKIIDF